MAEGLYYPFRFLEQITRAYHALPGLENLLFDDFFRNRILEALPAWRKITADCLLSGIPIPCMAAALTYFDGLRTERSSANLIQAQRDYFGALIRMKGQIWREDNFSIPIGMKREGMFQELIMLSR